jgi:Undecaprenyl-phosphate glucose phosphotransferase
MRIMRQASNTRAGPARLWQPGPSTSPVHLRSGEVTGLRYRRERRQEAFKIRFPLAATGIVVLEFLVVAAVTYGASIAYYRFAYELQYALAAGSIATVFSVISVACRQYRCVRSGPLYRYLWSGVGTVMLAHALFLSGLFLFKGAEGYSRAIFFIQLFSVAIAVFSLRAVIHAQARAAISSGLIEARRAVLFGEVEKCAEFARRLRATGVQTIRCFQLPGYRNGNSAQRHRTHEMERTSGAISSICRPLLPDDIVILTRASELPAISILIRRLSDLPASIHVVLTDTMDFLAGAQIVEYGNTTTLQAMRQPLSAVEKLIKRAFDVSVSLAGLIVFLPLFLLVAIAIKLDSKGPVLFRQTRHGFNNIPIKVFKFRTMITLEDGQAFRQAVANDARVTRIGRVLRRTNIDELPQLLNVLSGDMSIVGPRPHPTALNEMFQHQIWPFERRHNVKPGITGWAQVNGCRGETDTVEKMQRRVQYDLHYIDNWSLLFDVQILLLTIFSKAAYRNAY